MNATSHMYIGIIGRTIFTKFGTDTVSMKHIFFLVKKDFSTKSEDQTRVLL